MTVHEVAFELELFEWSDGRLDVAGRWRGLGGRRLARPVLTVQTDAGRRKRVVAMPGGQIGAGDGGAWNASFNWPGDPAEIIGAELELGRNVVVDLPLPDRKRRRRRRTTSSFEVPAQDEGLKAEIAALRAQVDRLRSELAGRERETMRLQAELDAAVAEPVGRDEQRTVAIEDLAVAGPTDSAPVDDAELERLRAELEEVSVRHARERERWQVEIDELREAFADAAAEAEQTRERHTAEIEAVRADAAHERRAHLLRRHPAAADLGDDPAAADDVEAAADPDATVADIAATPAGAGDTDATVADIAATPAGAGDTDAAATPAGAADTEEAELVATPAERVIDILPPVADAPGPLRAGSRPSLPPMTEEAPPIEAPAQAEPAVNGTGDQATRRFTAPDLHALRGRITALMPSQRERGEREETATEAGEIEPIQPIRSASAARARAGASFAARRSTAEVWGTRIIAAVVVAVLLIAFLLLLASLG